MQNLKFKQLPYQTEAVQAVVDCFAGQPKLSPLSYRIDPGREAVKGEIIKQQHDELDGFKNSDLMLIPAQIFTNIQNVQQKQNLPISDELVKTKSCSINLDIEMETGTGKTYCYIKTMFEMNKRYGWNKFIVVVPSIAIREGVYQSFDSMADHFLEEYGKRVKAFIYNSKSLHEIENFSSDAGINVMVINVQAFAARGKDARRIYMELDDFQSRRPIDVIKKNRPILILDEPQKMEGKKTMESLAEFEPLFTLRYSATHKTEHNKIHRLDALDAYNQKLVKKIAVRGISIKGLSGTNAYLYLQSIEVSATKPPVARVEFEIKQNNGIKRIVRKIGKGTNLFDESKGLEEYKDFVVSDIDAVKDTLSFTNGIELTVGDAIGDVNEEALRRIQIRETIKAHFDKEQVLFHQGLKVLSLFFIDEVAKYRNYETPEDMRGEYAKIFEEEYNQYLNEVLDLEDTKYNQYLSNIATEKTHEGYFSKDKKKKFINSTVKRGAEASDDVDAYDLILKDKKRLLSLDEPVRFIFSHSALREGWDNPNVFNICQLKNLNYDNTITRRQELGRGLRLAVNQNGERMDNPLNVHQINVLTVIANESYKDFVKALLKETADSLSARPKAANEDYFQGKTIKTKDGSVKIDGQMARQIYRYLVKNDYTDDTDMIVDTYHEAKREGALAVLPDSLKPYTEEIHQLISGVFSASLLPDIEDGRKAKENPLNANFDKKEFQQLWSKINRKAVYTVDFDSNELISKCVKILNEKGSLKISPLQYVIESGAQTDTSTYDSIKDGTAFKVSETTREKYNSSIKSSIKYDLIGQIAENTQLTRRTIGNILKQINTAVFSLYSSNPEDFISKVSELINEQKATTIIEHLSYDPLDEVYDTEIFTAEKPKEDFSKAIPVNHHIYDYVFTDSDIEKKFVQELDTSTEVVVYAKLPRGFSIPTPVGSYNPDWAISFKEGAVKHVYFIAETKGTMSSLQLKEIENVKIKCAKKFFKNITSEQVKYDVVNSYEKLMQIVQV
ncbi:Type III restriction enzyme, res subunit:DEAD/DEAH box helicase, N-terminal [hydrothermal vent metagenome]|uniref:Type III restriction enzyme, res subunit:DEAD/DEAH box helicase, N-terminal n=1 Tax=hydrothermal vent metagenome TaxID=652676 RepID=A0A3B0WHS7_9ZZZZ